MDFLYADVVVVVIACLAFLASLLFLSYLAITEKNAPRLRDSLLIMKETMKKEQDKGQLGAVTYPTPLVTVVIPARNEENSVGKCLLSLSSQTYSNLEIIVVDDSSADRTREVVETLANKFPNMRIVAAGPKPEGWVGKAWPCWRGFEESKGEFLLFIDADSALLERETVRLCLNYVLEKRIDMFSISPRIEMHGVWARSVLPILSGAINLLYPMRKVNDKRNERAYVFGTFILVSRMVYESTGGHKQVRSEIVEDAAIGRLAKSSGYNLRIERAPELLSTEWEQEPRSIYHGLERVTSTSIKAYGLLSILNAILLFFVSLFPIIFVMAYAIIRPYDSPILEIGFGACMLNIFCFLVIASFELNAISGRTVALSSCILYPLGMVIFISAIVTTSLKVSTGAGIKWKEQGYKQSSEYPRKVLRR